MFKNYLKIAWRNLFRNKGFSITNLLGLTIGITCTMLILLWVNDELRYDKFHANYNQIYQVIANRKFDNQIFTDENMILPLAQSIEQGSPQVKYAVVTTQQQPHVFTYGDLKLKEKGYTVSDHFFNMFSWKFVQGNPATALSDAHSVVLTQSAAKALFGKSDPINKVVKIDNHEEAKVTAILADPPGNSTFQFDFFNAFNYSDEGTKRSMNNWQNSSWRVYVQALPGANLETIQKQINDIKTQHDPNDKKISTYFMFPMSKWRLSSDFKDGKNVGGLIDYVRMFTLIAVIILLIACINFMNLSTARSEKRAKEVGVRKTLGSDKKQLIIQFFFESMILSFLAFIFSMLAVFLSLPLFNSLVDKHLSLPVTQSIFWLGALIIILFTGLVAGSYPALYLSSFNPIKVLKGTFLSGRSGVLPRRVLVVAQFIISILLISATSIVYQQIQHIKDRNTGYDPNNLLMIYTTPDTQKNFAVIKDELRKTGLVHSITRTLSPITQIWWKQPAPEWSGRPANSSIIFSGLTADVDFTKTMGIKVLQGQDFSGLPSDSAAMLLNKAAVDAMGLKNPIGLQVKNGKSYQVIGVIDNVIMESPFKPVDPMMVIFDPEGAATISIRLNDGVRPQQAIPSIEKIFKKYNPAFPFEYLFADEEYSKKFTTEDLISKLTNLFAGLAIFLCCMGIAGLASFTVQKRIREIGIRKVLGASVQQILSLISKEFLRLVVIAFVIAVPLTWWLMNNWLNNYLYRVDITVWLFGIVGITVLLLTLAVVSLNSIRAALRNPVRSLRTE